MLAPRSLLPTKAHPKSPAFTSLEALANSTLDPPPAFRSYRLANDVPDLRSNRAVDSEIITPRPPVSAANSETPELLES